MAKGKHTISIPGELASAASNGVVASADGIYDYNKNKSQEDINAETAGRLSGQDAKINEKLGEIDQKYGEFEDKTDEYFKEESAKNKEQIQQGIAGVAAIPNNGVEFMESLPATGVANKIYRVPDEGGHSYADYSWNGSAFVPLARFDYGVDDEPKAGSENLITSTGVDKAIEDSKSGKFNFVKNWQYGDYRNNVKELYIKAPIKNNCIPFFKVYSTNVYIGSCIKGTSFEYDWIARIDITNYKDGDIIPVICYQSRNEDVKIDDITGYVIITDKQDLLSKQTSYQYGADVYCPYCTNINNSPNICERLLQDRFSKVNNDIGAINNFVNTLLDRKTFDDSGKKGYYTNIINLSIGSEFNFVSKDFSEEDSACQLVIPIKGAYLINASFITFSNQHCNSWLTLDADRNIIRWDRPENTNGGGTLKYITDYIETPLTLYVKENEEFLVLQITQEYFNTLDALKVDVFNNRLSALENLLWKEKIYSKNDLKGVDLYGYSTNGIGYKLPINKGEFNASSNVAGQLVIPLNYDDIIEAYFKTKSNWYICGWAILDENYVVLSWDRPYDVRPSTESGTTQYIIDKIQEPLLFNIKDKNACYLSIFVTSEYFDTLDNLKVIQKSVIQSVLEKQEVIEISSEIVDASKFVEIGIPDEIHSVVGDTLQLFYRGMFRCVNPYIYDINILCDIGAQYPRYFEVTPNESNIGEHTLQVTIKDNNNNVINSANRKLIVHQKPKSPTKELNVLCVGASATQGGQWASELKRRLTQSGGNPAGNGLTNINFVGRMNVAYNGKQVNLEATGGYAFSTYLSTNSFYHKFYFTNDVRCGNLNVGDVYSWNGNNFVVSEINITEGVGNISCTCSTVNNIYNTTGGTLTRVSGTGDEAIMFNNAGTSGNPFVFDEKLDIKKYVDTYCNGKVDVVYTELYGNGTVPYTDDNLSRIKVMEDFIKLFRDAYPNVKFCIGLMWNEDIFGGAGTNYGAKGGWSYVHGLKYTNINLCNDLQKFIKENNMDDYVYIVNWLNELDEENSFPSIQKQVNVRNTLTEKFGTNGVHPIESGYNLMADTAYRLFVGKFCQ